MKTKFGPNFEGLPFDNHFLESKKLSNRWGLLQRFYVKNIQKKKSKKDEKSKAEVAQYEEKLKNEIFFCSKEFKGLLAKFSSNPPRNPENPP